MGGGSSDILDVRHLLGADFIIFSHSISCCFVWIIVSFTLQKLFSFVVSNVLIVNLSIYTHSVLFQKSSPEPVHSWLSSTSFPIRLGASAFMLMSFIHLELSFLQCNKYRFTWFLLCGTIQFNQNHLLEALSFSSLNF